MLSGLRRRLTVVFTLVTGAVAAGLLAAALAAARGQTVASFQAGFDAQVDEIAARLQSGQAIHTAWLAQLEEEGLVVEITDNGLPSLYSSQRQTEARTGLLRRGREALAQKGTDLSVLPSLRPAPARTNVCGEGIRAAGQYIEAARGWYTLLAVQTLDGQNRALGQLYLLYGGLFAAGLAALAAVNWLLAGWALRPTAEAMARQTEFVAAASHELRSPLTVLQASLDGVQGRTAADARLLATAGREIRRLGRLVGDMLVLAGADTDRWAVRADRVETDTLLICLWESWQPVAAGQRRTLRLELPDELPCIRADRQRTEQVLAVFWSNALEYTPPESPLELCAKAERRQVWLGLRDHGAGLSDDEKKAVLRRFYRGDQSRTGKSHFGLGLSVAAELCGVMGGRLVVEDTPGGGVTFWAVLPAD